MAKENNSSAMDVDNQNWESVDQINSPRFSINVLQLLKSAQMQHGLRFGDYARYRRYCTARLRRLYKSLKFTHGRGKYSKRAITASMVTEVRYLHVVLYTAERAWILQLLKSVQMQHGLRFGDYTRYRYNLRLYTYGICL
nr:signal recognition particle subunit SRP68-like [Coffea arabica]